MADIKTKHGLQETKGSFQLRGIVNGVDRDSFYKEITTKSNKSMRMVNFGAEVDKGKTIYVALNGMERDKVYFSAKQNDKTVVEAVDWDKRKTFKKKDFNLIGIRLGLKKVINKEGKEVNDKQTMTEFDACEYINENLADDVSVYTRGKVEFSTYNDKHYTKFVPDQISLCKPIDFEDDEFESLANFEQTIILTGVTKNEDGTFTVNGKVVTYNTIEDVEFFISAQKQKLAKTLKKLNPYTALKVFGNIVVEQEVDTVEDDDDAWGDPNPMNRISNPTQRKMFITGADKDSLDTELYSEESVEAAIAKLNADKKADKDFGSSDTDDWGSVGDSGSDDDDEWD